MFTCRFAQKVVRALSHSTMGSWKKTGEAFATKAPGIQECERAGTKYHFRKLGNLIIHPSSTKSFAMKDDRQKSRDSYTTRKMVLQFSLLPIFVLSAGLSSSKAEPKAPPSKLSLSAYSVGNEDSVLIFQVRIRRDVDSRASAFWVASDGLRSESYVDKSMNWSAGSLEDVYGQMYSSMKLQAFGGQTLPKTREFLDIILHVELTHGQKIESRVIRSDFATLMRFFAGLDRAEEGWKHLVRQSLIGLPAEQMSDVRGWESLDVESLRAMRILTDVDSVKFIPE